MTARILDGNAIRNQIYAELGQEIASLRDAGIRPGLAAVLVGDNPASQLYVKSKIAACEKLGLASFLLTPPASITTAELLALVDDLNRKNDVDGILVQMPLPSQVDAKKILDAVTPEKDVDGFHPDQRRQTRRRPAESGGLHAARRHGNFPPQRHSRSKAPTPWSWDAATSWASPWPCS